MKVAIAKEGDAVSEHFGHCEAYAIYSIENSTVVRLDDLVSPGHTPGFLPGYLAEREIKVVIAGGMGPRAIELFCEHGIDVVIGVRGPLDDAAQAFAAGELVGGESACHHDESGEGCGSH
jgi:predicted Fe-Mo cluster-binding NifX family protein